MKTNIKRKILLAAGGVGIGFINGILGAGGGMLAVPLLKKAGLSQKQSHTSAIAVILPITLVSATMYLLKGLVNLNDAWIYIPTGILGALIGTWIIQKISPVILRYVFCALMIYAGVRLLFK